MATKNTRNTKTNQSIFNREGREVTRRGEGGKDETGESRNLETEIRIGPITSSLSPLTFCLYAASSPKP